MRDEAALRANPTEAWIENLRARYPTEPSIDAALSSKLRKRGGTAYSTPPLAMVAERLGRFLSHEAEGPVKVRDLRALTGGASKEQYVFELDWRKDGEDRIGERMVLRCEPAASIVETSRRREFELMHHGGQLMPVPPVYWMDEEGGFMGTPSLISGFVEGVQKPAHTPSNVSGMGIHFTADYRKTLAPEYIGYMVALHSAELEAGALPSFVRPETGTTQAANLAVNWWARCWAEDLYEDVPIGALAEHWLRRNAPKLDRLSIVHGDFRTGNFLFDERTRRITAVLDWELGYLGDRHGDLAWVLTELYQTREDGRAFCCGLFEGEAALIEAYEEAGGPPINPKTLHWHRVFCTWKALVLSLGAALRAGNGLTHQDVLLSWIAASGYPVSEALRRLLEEG